MRFARALRARLSGTSYDNVSSRQRPKFEDCMKKSTRLLFDSVPAARSESTSATNSGTTGVTDPAAAAELTKFSLQRPKMPQRARVFPRSEERRVGKECRSRWSE